MNALRVCWACLTLDWAPAIHIIMHYNVVGPSSNKEISQRELPIPQCSMEIFEKENEPLTYFMDNDSA